MQNYKALKAANKASVQKVKVVDRSKVDEVKDEDGNITTYAQEERSHEELQVVCKRFDPDTGEAQDDSVKTYSLLEVKREIEDCKSRVAILEAEQAEWEQHWCQEEIESKILVFQGKLFINRKNVIPKENISHFSGLNYPILSSFPVIIIINSGAI